MKLQNLVNIELVEMAMPPERWKQINKLLKDDKYDEAAKLFIKNGGTARGLTRSWNVAQGTQGSFAGSLDKDHDIEKFRDSVKEVLKKDAPKKDVSSKTAKEKETEGKNSLKDTAVAHETLKSKNTISAKNVEDKTAKGIDIANKSAKLDPPIHDAAKYFRDKAKKHDLSAKQLRRLDYFLEKEKKGEDFTKEERKEFLEMKVATEKLLPKSMKKEQVLETLDADLKDVKDSKELDKILSNLIDKEIRIEDRATTEKVIRAIKRTAKGDEAIKLSAKLRQIFRNTNNEKALTKLVDKAMTSIEAGMKHINNIDKVLNKYISGQDVNLEWLKKLNKEIKDFLPVMKNDVKFDKEGYQTYEKTTKDIENFIEKGEEPTIDDLEELLDDFANYHENIKKDIEKSRKKRSMKEDILYNLNF